jgi:hypothetical protein
MQPSDHISIELVYLREKYVSDMLVGTETALPRNSRQTKQYFGTSIESRLDVGINGLILVAGGAEIDDFNRRAFETVERRSNR